MKTTLLGLGLLFASVGSANAATNLLFNGSFETPVVTVSDLCDGGTVSFCYRGDIEGWSQTDNRVTLFNNQIVEPLGLLVSASDGEQFLDMNREGHLLGAISQTIGVTSGQRYHLSLDASAWALNAIGAVVEYELFDAGSNAILASEFFKADVGGVWTTRTLSAVATSSSIGVRIRAISSPEAAMGIDNVVLTSVPLSPSFGFLLSGIFVAGLARGRRATV